MIVSTKFGNSNALKEQIMHCDCHIFAILVYVKTKKKIFYVIFVCFILVGLGGLGGLGGLNALAVLFAIKVKIVVVAALVGLAIYHYSKYFKRGCETLFPSEG